MSPVYRRRNASSITVSAVTAPRTKIVMNALSGMKPLTAAGFSTPASIAAGVIVVHLATALVRRVRVRG